MPVAYRTAEARASNPERLNLDHRSLTVCPLLEGEQRLRLLNYQHNSLRRISNLTGVGNLIFLDLYNNQIESIGALDHVPMLRVLMLGKNRIRTIENLDPLPKLDVLDLHSNAISSLGRVGHLTELRVLNLAGNRIDRVDGSVRGMRSLTELNLRRNNIESCADLDLLPSLQRLFLSNNALQTLRSIACVLKAPALSELALDGNPLCIKRPVLARRVAAHRIATLHNLDGQRVTEAERNAAREYCASKEATAEAGLDGDDPGECGDDDGIGGGASGGGFELERRWCLDDRCEREGEGAGRARA